MSRDAFNSAIVTLTSPQVVQAFLVGVFSIVASVLVLDGQAIPETISGVLFAVVGYYFADSGSRAREQATEQVNDVIRRTDELTAYAQRMGLHAQVEPTDKRYTSENVTAVVSPASSADVTDSGEASS